MNGKIRYQVGPLNFIADVLSGFAFKSQWFDSVGDKIIRIGDIVNEQIIQEDCVCFDATKYKIPKYCVTEEGDILMALSGATTGKIGIVKIQDSGLYVNQRIAIIRGKTQESKNYLKYVFSGENLQKLLLRAGGAAQANLSPKSLKELDIPLPPLAEQKRIAAILDKADAIRRKRRQAIQLADEFLRSVFLDMFGDPATNHKQWELYTISELLADKPNAIRTGPFGSQLKHSEFTKDGIPVLGINNIVTNEFRWTAPRCLPVDRYQEFKRYKVFPDDVIITIMGTTGRVAITPSNLPECMSTKHLCVITINKEIIDPVFLWATLLYDRIVRNKARISGGGAIMEGWNMTIIKQLKLRVPPKDLQNKFRSIYSRKRELKKTLREVLKEDNIFFKSISQRAFRGEL